MRWIHHILLQVKPKESKFNPNGKMPQKPMKLNQKYDVQCFGPGSLSLYADVVMGWKTNKTRLYMVIYVLYYRKRDSEHELRFQS